MALRGNHAARVRHSCDPTRRPTRSRFRLCQAGRVRTTGEGPNPTRPLAWLLDLLAALERTLDRNNRWDLSVHEGRMTIVIGGEAIEAVLEAVPWLPISS